MPGGPLRLARGDARLTVADPAFAAALVGVVPRLRQGHRFAAAAFTAAAIFAVIVGGLWWRGAALTAVLAAALPPAWEQAIGDRLVAQLPFRRCRSEAGDAALRKLAARLIQGLEPPLALAVGVYDVAMVNAFAMPGGHVLLLRGLLRQADGPDEIAGVMAHEIGHVMRRDPIRGLVTHIGVGVAAQVAIGGGSGGSLAAQFATLSYSREVEAAADREAVTLLRRSGIGTRGFAAFFDRLAMRSPSLLPQFLSSHPAPAAREAALAAGTPTPPSAPVLSFGEWQALRDICTETTK